MTSEQLKQWSADILYLQDINRKQQAEIETLKYEKSSGVYGLANTLTDEEINELYADYQNPDYYSREVIFDQLGFARAILRKAQE